MKGKISHIILLVTVLMAISCGKGSIKTESDYLKWINKNLRVQKTVNGLDLRVKLLPAEYLAYKDLRNRVYSQQERDSLLNLYNKNLSFLLTIEPKEIKEGGSTDLMYYNISNEEEYMGRFQELTFNIDKYIYLQDGSEKSYPVLYNFENTMGLTQGRSIYLVFNKSLEDLKSRKVSFVFNDVIFITGISYFDYNKDKLESIPTINFWNRN